MNKRQTISQTEENMHPTDEANLNGTAVDLAISESPWKQTLVSMITIIGIVTFVGNLLVLISFCVEKKLMKSNFNLFLVNLAATDVLVSTTAIPFFVMDYHLGYWPLNEGACAFWIFMDWGMTFASIYTLTAISLDRYWAACWSTSYRMRNTRKKTLLIILAVWIFLLIMWTPPFIVDRMRWSEPGTCLWAVKNNREFVIFVTIAGYHGPSLIMIYCYIRVFLVMKKSKLNLTNRKIKPSTTIAQQAAADNTVTAMVGDGVSTIPTGNTSVVKSKDVDANKSNNNNTVSKETKSMAKENKIFLSLSYIIIAYLICWSPFHIVFDVLYHDENLVSLEWYVFSAGMCYINSAINPILYACGNKDFRRAFIKILTCGKCKGH